MKKIGYFVLLFFFAYACKEDIDNMDEQKPDEFTNAIDYHGKEIELRQAIGLDFSTKSAIILNKDTVHSSSPNLNEFCTSVVYLALQDSIYPSGKLPEGNFNVPPNFIGFDENFCYSNDAFRDVSVLFEIASFSIAHSEANQYIIEGEAIDSNGVKMKFHYEGSALISP